MTIGLSPKVFIPVVGQVIVGVIFLAFGLDVEGKTVLGTALGTLVTGYAALPGPVTPQHVEVASDALLDFSQLPKEEG